MAYNRGENVNGLGQTQNKVFTNWINSYLKKDNLEVENLLEDLSDGQKLLKLIEILWGESSGRINEGKSRFHKLENVNRCLEFLKTKVRLENIRPEDVLSGNPAAILALLWTIVVNFQIAGTPDADKRFVVSHRTAKDALLLWCQRRTQGYRGVRVHDFGPSWRDGLAFCALIHSERRDLIRFETLDRRNRKENLDMAFRIAESKMAIPKLLDAEDMDVERPDEISVMTYVSQFYHAFNGSSARMIGVVDPSHPKMEIVEKAPVVPPPAILAVPPRPARRLRLPNQNALPVITSPETDHIRSPVLANDNDAWACAHCPSVNLSTRTFCGSCYRRRNIPRIGTEAAILENDKDITGIGKRKAEVTSPRRFESRKYYVSQELPPKEPQEEEDKKRNKMEAEEETRRRRNKMAAEEVATGGRNKQVSVEQLAAKIDKMEADMEKMKQVYYAHLEKEESHRVSLESEVRALREQLLDLGVGWESNKSKMARVERMLLNIATQKRTM